MEVTKEKAHSTILLSLADKIIIKVLGVDIAVGLWLELESLYMTKSLTKKLFLKQHIFALKMHEGTQIQDHLDRQNFIMLDMRNID